MSKNQNIISSFNKIRGTNELAKTDSGLKRYYTNDVTSEPDACLQGLEGSIAFNKMSRNDSIIGGILRSYENPIQSARWGIEEIVDATPREQEVYDILTKWFFQKNNFNELLSKILTMLPMGFSLFEKYYTPFEINNNKYMMPVLSERVQTSIRRIDYQNEYVEQFGTGGSLNEIPFKDLVFFTFRQVANDRRGTSLLRQAYYDYVSKFEIKKAGTKGVVRSMIGLIVGTVPNNINENDESVLAFADLILNLGQRDFNGLSDSAIKSEGFNIEILNSSFDLSAMKEYVAYLDSSMTMSVLTQFITLGQSGGGGSYSLGRDASDMLLDGLGYIIDYIETKFTQEVLYPAIIMNFSDVDYTKFRLTGDNLNKKNSKEFAETIKSLIDSGIIKVELDDEIKIRKMYDLPAIDLKQREQEIEAEEMEIEDNIEEKTEIEEQELEDNEAINDENNEIIKLSENWKNASERRNFKQQELDKLNKFSRASLQLITDEFSKVIRRQLNKGSNPAQGLKDLKINNIGAYKKRMGQKLAGIANQAWKNAFKNSKSKIKLSEIKPSDLPTSVLSSFVINQADVMIDDQINQIRDMAILTANTSSSKGLSPNNTMAMVDKKMQDFIEAKNKIDVGNELAIVQAMNYGEMQYYKSIQEDLWGYRFTNDIPETEICKSLVGKTYRLDSSELDIIQPPLHFRCDSYLVPIYKSQESQPQFDDYVPAPSILKQKNI